MKITIKTIPQAEQRYETIGDYWWNENGDLEIRVTDTGNWKYEALVALHEFVEVMLTKDRGITEPDIMAFDKAFEANRQPGNNDEPGDDPKAPYGKEHRFAENLERLFAAELAVNWARYDDDLCKIWHAENPT